jgi:hypothetical protein
MDLGFIVPAGLFGAVQLLTRKPIGYLLGSVLIVKGIAMLIAISMMIINMMIQGVNVSWVEMVIFFGLTCISCGMFVILLKNTKEKAT